MYLKYRHFNIQSYLENAMGRGAWQATVYGTMKSRTQLSETEHNM